MTLYLDTSSLARLYIDEVGSDTVRALVRQAAVVTTSQIAYAEFRAALTRRWRDGALRAADFRKARRAFEADWPHYVAIEVTSALCQEAGGLAERFRLRGFDSVHLASFAMVLRSLSAGAARFSSFDEPLNRAARALLRARRPGRK
ncbi:MAG: hypothetical protein A3J29_20305 [Acidobacteria bacterium RIFCSPLOWO2_12_FULL_67_14b]|nr:MAG: hypothetical protein A3J29_20305 [Acidobacteria bacterium RIFCSPLOWO2_12_FULL_67_14b]